MDNHEINQLKIDPELRLLVCPLSEFEYSSLEQQILTDDCTEPVFSWYGFLIYGYERAEICQKHGIPCEVREINFRGRVEIVSMICKRELDSRILPAAQRRYLIGRLYEAERIINAHRSAGTDLRKEKSHREYSASRAQNPYSGRQLQIQLGNQYHLNPATVSHYATYAHGIDRLYQTDPEKAREVLQDKLKIPSKTIMGYGANPAEKKLRETARKSDKSSAAVPEPVATGPNIKDMPEFDPDAEINSLALTIPSWVQSMGRTRNTAKFQLITQPGRERLIRELRGLISAADKMLSALEVK